MLSKSTPSPSRNFTLRGSRAICWGRQSSAVRYLSSSTVSFSTFPERTATSAAVSPTGPEPTTSTEILARHCLKPSRLTFTTTYRATTTKVLTAVSKARAPYFSSAVFPIPPTPAFSGCNPSIPQGGANGCQGFSRYSQMTNEPSRFKAFIAREEMTLHPCAHSPSSAAALTQASSLLCSQLCSMTPSICLSPLSFSQAVMCESRERQQKIGSFFPEGARTLGRELKLCRRHAHNAEQCALILLSEKLLIYCC
ncbi:hypothetical protein ILYODFUR_014037 [Ilyodon furcidens]|uniref:Uncharacterized protein n=1 Tax=Ilyodon furcidens TaxID=33524 RepID=A0ABV0SZZ4_9TELE